MDENPQKCNVDGKDGKSGCLYVINSSNSSVIRMIYPMNISKEEYQIDRIKKPILVSNTSNFVFYVRDIKNYKQMICKLNLENEEEICFPSTMFYDVDNISYNESSHLVFQAQREINHCISNCEQNIINKDIFVLNLSNGKVTEITNSSEQENDPVWIEGMDMIAYRSFQNNSWKIYISSADGDWKEQISESTRSYYLNIDLPHFDEIFHP